MPKHLQREIETLKKRLLVLVAEVETAVYHATLSIENRDAKLARQVIENDDKIDQAEVEVEEDCLKLLALYQPVAIDLRFIVAAMKINNDLERIGDLAVNIAERAEFLATQPKPDISFDFTAMARIAQRMLKKCIDAFVELNTDMAQEVCATDDQIDAMNREMYLKVQDAIIKHPDQIASLIHLLSVSRHLERIADHATNIAEDVLYMIEGRIFRHKTEDYKPKS